MATSTTKLGLTKPAYTDVVDVQDLNTNADLIDAASGMTICTSSTRPGSPWSGQIIFETDTPGSFVWDGSAWQTAGGGGSITVAETAPTSPAPGNGDLWFNSTDGRTFVYYEDTDSNQWVEIGQVLGGGGASVTVDSTAPASPSNGDMWWDTDNGNLYLYYDDGTSQQWVSAAGPSVAVQDTAPTGYEGQLWLDSTDGSMYTYYTDPGGTASSWIGAVSRSGGILQVVNSTYDTLVSTTSTSFVTSGLSASITPRSTSSKILILAYTNGYHASTAGRARYTLFRGTVADTNLSSEGTLGTVFNPNAGGTESVVHLNFLDSPSTTSTVTYTLGLRTTSASGSVSAQFSNTVSSMTLIEVAG